MFLLSMHASLFRHGEGALQLLIDEFSYHVLALGEFTCHWLLRLDLDHEWAK